MHGDDDQIVPIGASALESIKLLPKGTLKVYEGCRTALQPPIRTSSIPIFWSSSSSRREDSVSAR